MSPIIPISLFGWIVITLFAFAMMPHRRAALVSVLGATLFLPMAKMNFQGLPELHKFSAVGWGVLAGLIIFCSPKLFSFRYGLVDLLMLGWILVSVASILSNDLEASFALSSMLSTFLTYGVPYLAGRALFRDLAAARDFAMAMVIGAAVYVPLCWIEIRLSPQLHTWVYGFHQHSFLQSYRDGGWRPTVFMQHGLMVAAWMMSGALLSAWMWAGGIKRLWMAPTVWVFAAIAGTLVFMRSLGALLTFGAGLGLLAAVRTLRIPALVIAVALVPATYLTARVVLRWDAAELVSIAEALNPERAQSLAFRIRSEEILIERAMERPWLGWGGYGRNQVLNEEGKSEAVTDSLWIATLGVRGVLGLACLYGWLIAPAVIAAWKCRNRSLEQRDRFVVLGLCSVSLIFVIDTMFNAMINQVFFMLPGVLLSVAAGLDRIPKKAAVPAPVSRPSIGPAGGRPGGLAGTMMGAPR